MSDRFLCTVSDVLPTPGLYVRHALALLEAAEYLSEQLETFSALIPEEAGDDVAWRHDVWKPVQALIDGLGEQVKALSVGITLTEADYHRQLAVLRSRQEYVPIEHLEVIRRLRAAAHNPEQR
jgi:hypothetical protein